MRRLQVMGVTGGPRPLSDFTYVSHSIAGTPRNLALMLGVASFVSIEFPEVDDPAAEDRITTTWLTDQIDWTKPHVVDTGVAGKPVLLMTMDSFSTALLPFLYGDFSRIVLTHNQDGFWRQDLIDRFKPDIVITEVVESGFQFAMQSGPVASREAFDRIDRAIAHPARAPPAAALAPTIRPAPGQPRPPAPPIPLRAAAPGVRPLPPVQGRVVKIIDGGPGDDLLQGTPGDDVISGRGGNDTLHGGAGADILRGGKGNDLIDGGPGGDQIWGDLGDDTLTGGPGADRFYIRAGGGNDVVTDFNPGEGDRIVVPPATPYQVRQDGRDTLIELRGASLRLRGVRAATLPPGWLVVQTGP